MAVADTFHCYRVGAIDVAVVSDGSVTAPLAESFVLNAPVAEVRAALAASDLPTDTLTTTFAPLVLSTGGRRVVVDTGWT